MCDFVTRREFSEISKFLSSVLKLSCSTKTKHSRGIIIKKHALTFLISEYNWLYSQQQKYVGTCTLIQQHPSTRRKTDLHPTTDSAPDRYEALMEMPGGSEALPHVRLSYGQPSRCLWEDESGNVHHIHQGEGGEQGDALMPLLFSLGQHSALEAVRAVDQWGAAVRVSG